MLDSPPIQRIGQTQSALVVYHENGLPRKFHGMYARSKLNNAQLAQVMLLASSRTCKTYQGAWQITFQPGS